MHVLLFFLAILSANVAFGAESADVYVEDEMGTLFGLGLMAAVLLIVLFVVGLGIAIGLALCATIGGLVAMGVLSTSVLIAFLRRNPADGLRALFIQAGAVGGAVCGIAAVWLVPHLAEVRLQVSPALLLGGATGLLCGAALGCLFNYAWSRTTAKIVARFAP